MKGLFRRNSAFLQRSASYSEGSKVLYCNIRVICRLTVSLANRHTGVPQASVFLLVEKGKPILYDCLNCSSFWTRMSLSWLSWPTLAVPSSKCVSLPPLWHYCVWAIRVRGLLHPSLSVSSRLAQSRQNWNRNDLVAISVPLHFPITTRGQVWFLEKWLLFPYKYIASYII